MEQTEIDNYTFNLLKKQLQKQRLNAQGLYLCINNVKDQLNNIIKHWNDSEFLNAIFITVTEDGTFYEPDADNKIKNLVALGIRNSKIELAASTDYKQFGLKNAISDKAIKEITSEAISYFNKLDLTKISKKITLDHDYYEEISKKYPLAFQALTELGKCSDKELEREFKVEEYGQYIPEGLNLDIKEIQKEKDVENGISENFSDFLSLLLGKIYRKEIEVFYIDSFKRMTRNFEKTMKILEFIITNDAIFITNNFLIKKGYVSRRPNLIKAGRGDKLNKEALSSLQKISKKYEDDLIEIAKNLLWE